MTAHVGTWVRVMPSGNVHYVVGVSTGGTRWLACERHLAMWRECDPPCAPCLDSTASTTAR